MYRIVLLIVFIFESSIGFTQEIENLKNELNQKTTDQDRITTLFQIADYYMSTKNELDSLRKYTTIIESKIDTTLNNSNTAHFHEIKTSIYYSEGKHNKAISHGLKAIDLFTKLKENKKIALVKLNVGSSYQGLFKGKEAIQYFKEAEKDLNGNKLISLYHGLGNTYTQLNDFKTAIIYLKKAEKLIQKHPESKHKLGLIYNSLASMHHKNKDHEYSVHYFKKSIEIAKKEKDYLSLTLSYHNFGWYYFSERKNQKALENLKNAYALIDKIDHIYLKGMVHQNYARVLIEDGQLDKAEVLIDNALNLYKKTNNNTRIPYILRAKASLYEKKGDTLKVIAFLKKSLELSKENEIAGVIKTNYYDLSQYYEAIGEERKALEMLKAHNIIKDSIAAINKTKEIEALKVQFDVNEMEQDLKIKDQQIELLDSQKKASNYRNILLAVLGFGLLLFLYRQRRINEMTKITLMTENELNRIREEQMASEMKFKNAEITEYAVHINERNRLLDDFSKKIKDIHKLANDRETKDQLKKLQFYITEHIDINQEKIELNTKVKRTEESFIFYLKEKYPELTDKEIKVATYLLLDLPSKTIANQMNINQQSVNNYRFSIRKKLGLSKEDQLNSFLKEL